MNISLRAPRTWKFYNFCNWNLAVSISARERFFPHTELAMAYCICCSDVAVTVAHRRKAKYISSAAAAPFVDLFFRLACFGEERESEWASDSSLASTEQGKPFYYRLSCLHNINSQCGNQSISGILGEQLSKFLLSPSSALRALGVGVAWAEGRGSSDRRRFTIF